MKIFNGNITTEDCREETAKAWNKLTEGKQIEFLDHKVVRSAGDRIIQSIIYRIINEKK